MTQSTIIKIVLEFFDAFRSRVLIDVVRKTFPADEVEFGEVLSGGRDSIYHAFQFQVVVKAIMFSA